jgi:hypothetical protein
MIEPCFVVMAIFSGLPSEFKTIVVVLEAEDTTLTVDGIQRKLKSMEQNLQATMPPVVNSAMNAHVPGPRVCTYCKKTGHSAERCYLCDPENLKKYPPRKMMAMPTMDLYNDTNIEGGLL